MNITQKIAFPLLAASSTLVLWGGVTATPSYALGFFGNLPSNDGGLSAMNTNNVTAVSFTLPTGNDYSLSSVILRLGSYNSGDTPVLTIRNDTGGSNPGSTVLASFTNPTPLGAAILNYTFNPSSAFTFQAGTKYWLNLGISAGSITWLSSGPNVTPTGTPTFGAYRISGNNGTTFNNSPTLNSFQIDAVESVPEPSTMAGAGVAAAFGYIAKRKVRSAR